MKHNTIINIGSINVDHVYRVPYFVKPGETLPSKSYQRVLGGKGANQSVALARAGETVKHIGVIGDDHTWIIDELKSSKVDASSIEIGTVATGHALIQVDDNAENCILLFAGANHELNLDTLTDKLAGFEKGGWVLFQNEMPNLNQMISLVKKMGARVAVNPAPFDDEAKAIDYDLVDLLIVNDLEAEELARTKCQGDLSKLAELCPVVIVTRGTQGAICYFGDDTIEVPAFKVKAVDTTGAGDTFVGYILSSIAQNLPLKEAMQRASAASALAVTKAGASVAIPTSVEVTQFLETKSDL
ncbi:ribokinase [Kiloniella litopenaei]|uniref:ribokinase n=1 Tax=Kiloniella litopenaei TaxID=1549748 RepID=UPI0009E61120|nr:ribokinase [Kiloniella litopenaei]